MSKQINQTAREAAQPIPATTLAGQVSDKQIQEWKKQHEKIFAYEADGRICYLKKANRTIVSAANTLAMGKDGVVDPTKIVDVVIENCWLGGDETLRSVDKYLMGLSNRVQGVVEVVAGELKEL